MIKEIQTINNPTNLRWFTVMKDFDSPKGEIKTGDHLAIKTENVKLGDFGCFVNGNQHWFDTVTETNHRSPYLIGSVSMLQRKV